MCRTAPYSSKMPEISSNGRSPGLDRTLLAQCGLGLALWLSVAVKQGYDIDWDVLNYHFYNGFALLHGKVFANFAVSMQQSYFAPVMDAAFYILVSLLPPTAVLASIAAFQSLAFPIIFQLARTLLRNVFGPGRWLTVISMCLALLGAYAPVNIWEAGGAFGDSTSAVFVLAALLLAVDSMTRNGGVLSPRRAAIVGALAGFAAGLKLTNMSFALGLVAVIAVPLAGLSDGGARRVWLRSMAVGLFAMAAAFLLTYGWWGALLWTHLGNPVFPNFNQVFHSPFAAPASYADPVFALPTVRDKLLYPFAHAPIIGHLSSSLLLDMRMAFALPLCIAAGFTKSIQRAAMPPAAMGLHAAWLAPLVFVPVSYAGWLLVFPIHRYLVAADMVAPLGCVVAMYVLWRSRRAVWTITAILGLALPASARVSRHY
jgi:hypothetical protein